MVADPNAASQTAAAAEGSVFLTDDTCWRMNEARQFSMVVDGAPYFIALREALLAARDQVMLIGWDFDLEINMVPGADEDAERLEDGYPNQLGPFLEELVEAKPDLDIHLLRWTGSTIIAPGRVAPILQLKFAGSDRIHVALDGRHPPGACHHQKIVVVDDRFAFCGGIDVTDARWDTAAHLPDDPRRRLRDGTLAPPWHDVTTALSGPIAQDLGDLARMRWQRATGNALERPAPTSDCIWPHSLTPDCTDVAAAIARTQPPEQDSALVNEIEALILASIARAQDLIYIESQYFASDEIAAAVMSRLGEEQGPEVIVLNPDSAQSFVEDQAMHVTRDRLITQISEADPYDRFRIWTPVNAADEPIYVHAKVCVIDDVLLRVGSSNVNRRSLGFDTECDIALEGRDAKERLAIAGLRNRLLAEHLDVSEQALSQALSKHPGFIDAIEALNGSQGRRLLRLTPRDDSGLGAVLADTRALDPRYDQDATARRGFTWRHLALGAVVLGALIWMVF